MNKKNFLLHAFDGLKLPPQSRTLLEYDYSDLSPNRGFFEHQVQSNYPTDLDFSSLIASEVYRIENSAWPSDSKQKAKMLLLSAERDTKPLSWSQVGVDYLVGHSSGISFLKDYELSFWTAAIINCYFKNPCFKEELVFGFWVISIESIFENKKENLFFDSKQMCSIYFFVLDVLLDKPPLEDYLHSIKNYINNIISHIKSLDSNLKCNTL
jgi:hypothetical protein